MPDTLQRFLFEDAPIRGEIVHLDATWRAVIERHEYPQPLRAALGELMAAAALLAATLKFEGTISLQLQGSGPVRLIVVECTSAHTLRATAKWKGVLPPGALRELLGEGRFVITLIPDEGEQSYQGVVNLDGPSVAAVLEHYMLKSEQLETRMWLAADDARAAGFLLQKLPRSEPGDEESWRRALRIAATLRAPELLKLRAPELLRRLYHEEDIRLFGAQPVSFRCSCTRERVVAMLRMLGHNEVRSIVSEQGAVEVSCEFCNRRYAFDPVDAELVFAGNSAALGGAPRH